ncbi:MAG: F0F1 ATP synthase subunit B [Chloroflexi bacterium]|nr:F0F1 ATP synthase subunit B [Chloroflexota bacterium]
MLGPVSISVPTLVVELVIFLFMVAAMEAWVFNPIRHAWAERDRSIQEGLEASDRSRQEAEKARAEVERILADARRRAQAEIDRGTAEGGKIRDQLVAQATQEFRQLLEQARQEVGVERQRSATTLRTHIVDIALEAASRVTGQRFDQPQVRQLAAAVVEREGLT